MDSATARTSHHGTDRSSVARFCLRVSSLGSLRGSVVGTGGGAAVTAVFDNLLPDSDTLRRRVAEKVGAAGTDFYSLLAAIGRDCVGALQFMGLDENAPDGESGAITGELVNESAIERLLQGLSQAPLGLSRDVDFRISVAGAQEKTALLRHKGQWWKPSGTTPTTHIFKKQIGRLPDGIDLSNSVENEFYCLRLAAAFGLPVTKAEIGRRTVRPAMDRGQAPAAHAPGGLLSGALGAADEKISE